jgi:hypothetical protein
MEQAGRDQPDRGDADRPACDPRDDEKQGATGSIIINSSMNAARPLGNYVTYSTTKAAVVALAKSAAVYCGQKKYRIRVNAILPGVVETDLIRNIMESMPDPAAVRAIYEGMAPLNRMARVEEVAGLVAYLASDEAAFVSGAEITIDGATTAGMMEFDDGQAGWTRGAGHGRVAGHRPCHCDAVRGRRGAGLVGRSGCAGQRGGGCRLRRAG